ncbi:MAG: hypothetical protein M3Q55_06820 [Acidobacteriota bacterium]|nr:hypothetical protein [Acidobacteriota bacterium]
MLRRYAGLVVASDVLFDDLPSASGAPDITIRRGSVDGDGWTFVQNWSDDTGDWLTIERGAAGYRLSFPELQSVVSADGSAITFDPPPGLADVELAHLLLHQILPLAVSRRGRLVLHACAVETSRGVIGLLGASGAGKSTLAAAFCARGCRLVADDALVIDVSDAGATAVPTADGVRLWEDFAAMLPSAAATPPGALGRKRRIHATLATATSPLVRLFRVGEASPLHATVEPISPADARIEMLSHVFRLDITDADESRRLFELTHRLAALVPLRRLMFPDGVEHLDPTVSAMLRDLETP